MTRPRTLAVQLSRQKYAEKQRFRREGERLERGADRLLEAEASARKSRETLDRYGPPTQTAAEYLCERLGHAVTFEQWARLAGYDLTMRSYR